MAAPVIMTVDDEPGVLNAVERDLRRHYRRDYRVIKAGSGAEALQALGVGRLFGPGTPTRELVEYLREEVAKRRSERDAAGRRGCV